MEREIKEFIEDIGAREPQHELFRKVFKRRHYFKLSDKFMTVKISRIKKPFWGLPKAFVDLGNELDDYLVVLLVSSGEGWVFSKHEVNSHVASGRWKLAEKDQNYKIHFPLPDKNSFYSPSHFKQKVGVGDISN